MSSITDLPINTVTDDLLEAGEYAAALADFILESDTPITIGLQGEWGTGKTSLMHLLNEKLRENEIATSWVNTWEYSIFRSSHEITPNVLNGMLSKLEISCKDEGFWDVGDDISQHFKKVSGFLGSVADQLVKKQTGVSLNDATGGLKSAIAEVELATIKSEISTIIDKLVMSPRTPYQKVVFFVDDLDRIQPSDAVEVLEALKNVFDMPNCIFVLAIDYDVVVKGLELKFGTKTKENEREFRSFFDKIIQVPFSMPTGAYKMDRLIHEKLLGLGIELGENELLKYSKTVKLTTGSNPRSLKRYLNSYSLVNQVRKRRQDLADSDGNLMLFILIGIQISFPPIFRKLLTASSRGVVFTSWTSLDAKKSGLDWENLNENINVLGENEYLDEDWERVVWGFCQDDNYLKVRVFDVLFLLNDMRAYFGDSLPEEMEKALRFASITNVDDALETKQNVSTKRSFSNLEKLSILAEYEAAPRGQGKIVLEKHSLYPAQISTWRRDKAAGKLN